MFFLFYIMDFEIKVNHQKPQSMGSQGSCCHRCDSFYYCNVGFVLFHNVTCYVNSPLSRIHVDTIQLLDITYTLVAIGVILQSLECVQL